MHVLIIGCGYLGLRAAQSWLQAGVKVSALTRSADRAEAWSRIGIDPIIGDVLVPQSLKSLPRADVCLYAVGFDRSGQASKREVYVNGLANVLSAIPPRISRLIYISSTSVYGQNHGEIVDQDSNCFPTSDGGVICRDAEKLVVSELQSLSENRATILRLAGLYGPGRLVARIAQLRSGCPLEGDPESWLNLIHVDDAVQAVLQLALLPRIEPTYLLSDTSPLRRADFYQRICALVEAPPPTFTNAGEPGLGKRCDSSRSIQRLGLTLRHPDALTTLPQLLQNT